jgi:hypothetical protein
MLKRKQTYSRPLRGWVRNRNSSPLIVIFQLRTNPVGAIIKALEKLYFGNALTSLLRLRADISEISHLTKSVQDDPNDQTLILIEKANFSLSSGLMQIDSGHILAPRLTSHDFLSGRHFKEIKTLMSSKQINHSYSGIPLAHQAYYYHFLIEEIPELIELLKSFPDKKIIMPDNQHNWVLQILDHFNLKYEIVEKSQIVELRDSVVKRHSHDKPSYGDLTTLRESVEVLALDGSRRKILILRKNLPRSDAKLNLILGEYGRKHGYFLFDPEEYSFSEQVKVFQSASKILAIHGGALSNIVFCEPGTEVIEVFSHPYRTYFFRKMSKMLHLKYKELELYEIEKASDEILKIRFNDLES